MPSFTPNTGECNEPTNHYLKHEKDIRLLLTGHYFSDRDTLAEKVPCLHFLDQTPRRDCLSVSHSENSFKDSMLSRQSSVSNAKFHRVSSMSTSDTVSLTLDSREAPLMVSSEIKMHRMRCAYEGKHSMSELMHTARSYPRGWTGRSRAKELPVHC